MPSTLAGPILRESERTTQHIDEAMVQWSADTLRQILEAELPDTQVIVVSNREPYIHNAGGRRDRLQIPASGLVTALEPVMRACAGTWIAHGSGSADRETVDADDHVSVPPASRPIRCAASG